ncbi:serine/threonine-protein kinase [Rhizobium jaguaris]|uniref:Serine/threonine protein kinase n=1 Tax=Rhizobium jaguaris TaxID=1312183 RepID=A0A387FXF7_9HYPH|nr:serine/threonine-protein kinase [Rhizobium jaguaris]AYG61915.1 serine/threonine protein kinase [Rhizobium jaguaris]
MSAEAQREDVVDLPLRSRWPTVEPGAILRGRFELIAEIGRGGLSVVYKARDLVAARAGFANAFVALKIIVEDAETDQDILALMYREARRLRDLQHPNIVRVYDMDRDGNVHFMVMEHLEGQTLAKILREAGEHRLELAQIERIVADISAALRYAHANNIIHADLKPGNVFIERSGRVKLIDFNIAYPVARVSRLGEEDTVRILGRLGAVTPIYASPQRLMGAEPSEGDDIYSLGVITYLMLTGERPFGAANALEAQANGISSALPGGLSKRQRAALHNALSLDDRHRTASAEHFSTQFTKPLIIALMDTIRKLPG